MNGTADIANALHVGTDGEQFVSYNTWNHVHTESL